MRVTTDYSYGPRSARGNGHFPGGNIKKMFRSRYGTVSRPSSYRSLVILVTRNHFSYYSVFTITKQSLTRQSTIADFAPCCRLVIVTVNNSPMVCICICPVM